MSILVKPAKATANQKPVLLNVPRKVALKVIVELFGERQFNMSRICIATYCYSFQVKPGTTLSFSASSDQKYTVIDNKIHPPVKTNSGGVGGGAKSSNPKSMPPAGSSHGFGINRRGQQYQPFPPRAHSLQVISSSSIPSLQRSALLRPKSERHRVYIFETQQ